MNNTIRVERCKLEVTQADLAKAVGVSRQTIYSIERGRFTPSILVALKIANFFSLKVEDIFQLQTDDL